MENMDDLLKDSPKLRAGDIVMGEVISVVDDKTAYIDVHAFTEGTLHLDHYTKDPSVTSLKNALKVGDQIKVKITTIKEDSIYLSCLGIVDEKILEELNEKFINVENIPVQITNEIKGIGFNASYKGVQLFMHKSQATKEVKVGATLDVRILSINANQKRPNIVISRFEVEKENNEKLRKEEYDSINVDDVLTGTVFKVEKYGALIKFNYVIGLLVPSQLSYKFVDITKELKVGDKIDVKVIKKENNKLDLSHKLLTESPFKMYINDKKVGDKVIGKVADKLDFGLLIQLNEDVVGFIHSSEYSHNPQEKFSMANVGDEIEAEIITIDESKKKISLSRKKLLPNPWENVNLNVGDIIKAEVKEINAKGLKVDYEGLIGLISLPDAKVEDKNLEDLYKVGDIVNAYVTDFKPKSWRLKLSIKKINENKLKKELEKQNAEVESITLGDVISNEE